MLSEDEPLEAPGARRDRLAVARVAASLATSLREAEDEAIRVRHGHERELAAMESDRDAWRARAEAAEAELAALRGLRGVRWAEALRDRRAGHAR